MTKSPDTVIKCGRVACELRLLCDASRFQCVVCWSHLSSGKDHERRTRTSDFALHRFLDEAQNFISAPLHQLYKASLVNSFTTTRSILREERSALRLKTMSSLLLPHHYGQKSATSPELLLNSGMTLRSWSAMAFSSLIFISSVMISKPGLQYHRGNNLPRARHQVLQKSSGCRALQALDGHVSRHRLTKHREGDPYHRKAVCERCSWYRSSSTPWRRPFSSCGRNTENTGQPSF